MRALHLAEERRQKDLEGVDEKPNGIPLEILDPHSDSEFAELIEKRREMENRNATDSEISALVASMNAKALSMAKGVLEGDRAFLDQEPEGVPLRELPLDDDDQFKKLESRRAVLKAQDSRKNRAEIKDLEAQLNERAHELARAQKAEDLDGLHSKPRGIPVELLKPHEDADFLAHVDELRQLKSSGDTNGVENKKAEMNEFLHVMASKHMDRDFLDSEPEGVPLKDIPLDEDKQFTDMESERATLKLKDARRNADKIKSLQRDLNNRAIELAKEVKKEDLSGVDSAPKGVPKESLYLHNDPKGAELIRQLRDLRKDHASNSAQLESLNNELNNRAHELAEQLMDGDRGAYLDPKPLGIPLEHLPLDTDATFKDLEVERAKMKASDPKANASAIRSTEGLLNERVKKLAKDVMSEDLEPFSRTYGDVPVEDLQPHNDKIFAGAAFQRRQNKLTPSAAYDDEEMKDVMEKRLIALSNEKKGGDLYFLEKNPEGVPLEDIPYLTDSQFQSMKAQREKLKAADAFENRDAIEKLEEDINERVRSLALEVLQNDFAKVNPKPMGIPLELLKPREDEQVKELIKELRRIEMTPALKSRAAGTQQKMDDRIHVLAREALEEGRSDYLDDNPEGVPLSILPLNTEAGYHDLDVQRAVLQLEDPNKNSERIKDLQEKLNEKAHDLALEQKEEDLKGVDKKPLGVPLELLKPHQDPKMATMINEVRVLKNDPIRYADKIRSQQSAMNDRAHELARNVLEGDRGYLGNEVMGVPIADLPLDADPTFHNLEVQRAAEKSKKSDSKVIKDLEEQLLLAAEDLARQQRVNDLSNLNPKPLGVPLELLNCHENDRFASHMPELRRLAKDPSRNAAKLKSLRDKLDDINYGLAEEYLMKDRERYLDATPEGIPFALLPLTENEEFKQLEDKKLALQKSAEANKPKLEEMEKQLNLLAHNIAMDQLKKDRDYLDQTPEGVPIDILPLDLDDEFRRLEAKRAATKAKNPSSQEIGELEERLNQRAHEMAKYQIQEDLRGLNHSPRGIPIETLKPHEDPIFAQLVEDLRLAKAPSSKNAESIADIQERMNERLDQLADNVLSNDRAYLPPKPEGIPITRLPLDDDPAFHAMEVERAQLKLTDEVKNASRIKELEGELVQRSKELAKELKANDLKGLNQAPRGIPLEILNLHKDAKCANMLEEKSQLVKSRSVEVDPVVQQLNSMAEQMADGLLKGDREYLDREPEGVPLSELNVDEDEAFHTMEVERAVLKATDPVKNASTILDLEDQLNNRAHQLAQTSLGSDRSYLDQNPCGVPLSVLPLDEDSKFHQMEVERARQKRKGNNARVIELQENLNKRATELAKKQLEDDIMGLDKEPEGYPIQYLNLHDDEEFAALIPKLREAKKENDVSSVRNYQAKLNDRAHEVAKERILNDRAELEHRPDGVPLDLLSLDMDTQFKTIEKDLRAQKANGNSAAVKEDIEKLNKRAEELAKDLRAKNRAYLDPEPEGIPIDEVPLDQDEPFKSLEVERLRLLAPAVKSGKKAEIAELEERLNKRATEVAAATKKSDREFLKDNSRGIPKEYLALDANKEFCRTERDLRRTLKHPERNTAYNVDDLKDKLQQLADEIAEQQLKGGRDKYLDVQPNGVDLVDLPLDEDKEFTDLELQRAIAVARQDSKSDIEDLEKKLNERCYQLAEKVVEGDREFLPKEINNIPIEELPLASDDKFKKLERRRRQHKRACKMDAVAEDEEELRLRATELAEEVIDQDLAPLKQCYRGIPTKELNLHTDEKFRDLASKRRRKRGQGRVKAVDMVAIEDDMDKRACEIADDLINEERAFLDQEPEGMHIMDVPLDDDPTFVQLEAEYRRRSKDPRVAALNKDVLRELCSELNQRSHALAREEFSKRREFMDPEPEGVPLYELGLDEDPEFKEAEIALYKNSKKSSPSPHITSEMQDRMNKRAQELARAILSSDRDFLDPEPEGVQLSELPLDSDQTFGDLARERRRKKKNLQRGAGEEQVREIEKRMNERSHEMARDFLNAERAFLEKDPEGVPLEDLPLNNDVGFRALEKERLKMKRDPASGSTALQGIESTLNDRCKQIAKNMLSKERAFLDKEPMGIPLEDLPLNHDETLNPIERRRRLLKRDPKRNKEEIRQCEDQMVDRVNDIATEFIARERAFMDQEPEGVPLRYLPLSADKEFKEMERQRRDLLQHPNASKKTIEQLETRMNERGHLLAKDLVEKGRSFLDPEPLGVPIADVPLNGDEQFRKMEEQRRSLKQDPRNATTVKALEEKLNDRSFELAKLLLEKERSFMDQKPLGIPLSDLPLNQDLRMREIERTRRLLNKSNVSGQHAADIAILEDGMSTRALELAKRTFEEERLFLDPEPCGVPVSDLPLFEDSQFHEKELQRLQLRKTKPSSEKIRTLEAELNARAKELAEEFIQKERQYLDQEPEGIPLSRLPLDKDAVFHDMEIDRRTMVRNGEDPARIYKMEEMLNNRAHELAQEIVGWQDKEFFDSNVHVAPEWPRIGEVFPEGKYDPIIPDEVSAGDVLSAPGDVGYLAPFIAALSRHPVLLKRLLVTEGHPVNAPYTFLFFDPNSNPVYVDVDDRVPCNENKEPLFVQSANRYWYPLLLEKAYAKFVGGYEKLDNCTPHETLRDLTGRPVTHAPFDPKLAEAANIGDASTVDFWRGIADDISRGDIVLAMSNGEGKMDGIHPLCSYALLGLVETSDGSNNASDMVVKLHNPYCLYDPYYNGPLELNDPNWTEDLRRICRFDPNRDDILYLPLPVFLRNFSSIQCCHINCGDRLTAAGAWDHNTAGGNPKFTTFRNNPIYLVENKGSRPTTILTEIRHSGPLFTDPDGLNHYPQTGIALLQPTMTTTPPTPLVTNSTHRFLQKGMMLDSREVCSIMELPPSSTCYLIPYTMKAGQMGSFNVSVYPGMAKVTLTPLNFAGLSREPVTTKGEGSPRGEDTRVDFMISDATTVHILLHQDKITDQKSVRKGDATAEDDIIFSVFTEQGIRCATTSEATNTREHSLAFKATEAGRYSILVTAPNKPKTGDAPCTISIFTPKRTTVKYVAPPAGARPLQQTRLPTLNKTQRSQSKAKPPMRTRRASSANDRPTDGTLPPIGGRTGGKRRSVSQGQSRNQKKMNTESARF